MSSSERAELQSHYPYMGLHLNELSVQEERLILCYVRGMTKAAAGRAAGYQDMASVYDIFKKPKITQAINYLREESRREFNFDRGTATSMYLEAHRKSANATEEKNIVDSLCKLHGLFTPESATQINIINGEQVERLENLTDEELLKIAGDDTKYLEPAK